MLTNRVSLEYSVLSTGLSVKVEMSIMVATATWYWRDQRTEYLILIDLNTNSHLRLEATILDSRGLDFSNLKAKN